MSERLDRCPTCRSQDVDREHADRCKVRHESSAAAVKHGRDLDAPIHGQKTNDLWAHFNTHTDPVTALHMTRLVIDLGWRPVVGKYDLWTPAQDADRTTDRREVAAEEQEESK